MQKILICKIQVDDCRVDVYNKTLPLFFSRMFQVFKSCVVFIISGGSKNLGEHERYRADQYKGKKMKF